MTSSNTSYISYLYRDKAYKNKIYYLLSKFVRDNYFTTSLLNSGISDKEIISNIRKKLNLSDTVNTMDSSIRGQKLAIETNSCLDNIKFNNILDIGCNNGVITVELGKLRNISADNIFGIDIDVYGGNDIKPCAGFIFKYYDGQTIPYRDNMFEFVMLQMVLHHIDTKTRNLLVNDVYRVMKLDGILLIKEHDVATFEDNILITVEHMLYDTVFGNIKPTDFLREFKKSFNPMNKKILETLLISSGFESVNFESKYIRSKYGKVNANNTYYTLWKKK